jgi:hypothetical protein
MHAELTLRRGQAYDALEKLRMAICVYAYNCDFKRDHVRGQCPNTRAENYLKKLEQDKKQAAELYCCAYSALLCLGLASDDPSLQPLLDNQLFVKDTSKPARLGDNRKEDPWFWQAERCCGLGIDDQEWAIESKSHSYLKARQTPVLTSISGQG